jgi:hypothetical protein
MTEGFWILKLNDMRSDRFEHLTIVCRADTKEELEAFLTRERHKGTKSYWKDGDWSKPFRRGPLEWYNDLSFGEDAHFVRLPLPPHVKDLTFIDANAKEISKN